MPRRKKTAKQSQLAQCKGCTINFFPKDKRQKFHNADCREKYYLLHYGSPSVQKTCLNCGALYSTTMPKKQSYCKPECREEHQLKSRDEVKARVVAERQTFLGERYATMQRDDFKCSYCGKGKEQGAVLDVVDDSSKLKTICLECRIGKQSLSQ